MINLLYRSHVNISIILACGFCCPRIWKIRVLIQSEKTRCEGPAKIGEVSITAKDVIKSICVFFVRMPYLWPMLHVFLKHSSRHFVKFLYLFCSAMHVHNYLEINGKLKIFWGSFFSKNIHNKEVRGNYKGLRIQMTNSINMHKPSETLFISAPNVPT